MKTCMTEERTLGWPARPEFESSGPVCMKKRILVVEDEPSILENILYSLQTEGFSSEGCRTGEEAQALLGDGVFDLVILDVGLPDTNGFDLCRELRSHSKVPVIFLTARAEEVDRVAGLEMGADDYVVKPFSPRELSARVRAVLRRYQVGGEISKEGGLAPGWNCGPFEVDEERCQISYDGKVLPLSSTEYRVLMAFCRKPGRVYSRAQLMDVAWDEPEAAMERTVDAHIKSLRAKLKQVREGDPIETHRGMGYSMKEGW
jgi:two-component system catabolic regulation response regulator CreB